MCVWCCLCRKLEDLQNDLSSSSQKLAKAEEACEGLREEKERELRELSASHEARLTQLNDELKELVSVHCLVCYGSSRDGKK